MERLTERTALGILVKENYEKKSLKTLYSCYGEKPNSYYSNCEEGYCAMEKLADYEDAEEQGRLFKLPCMDKFLESVSNQDFDGRISKVVEMLERKQLFGTISLIKDLKYYLDLAIEEKAHTCKCQHNSNSIDNEHCCGCDSKVSENDDTKNKVTSLEIIVRMIDNKPYYEIKYKKVGEDYYHVGYSSFNIDNVLKWRDECFELVDVKVTNADGIRNMSDEELTDTLFNSCLEVMHIDECPYADNVGMCKKCILDWLQSEAE